MTESKSNQYRCCNEDISIFHWFLFSLNHFTIWRWNALVPKHSLKGFFSKWHLFFITTKRTSQILFYNLTAKRSLPKHFIRVALLQWGHLYFFILQFDDKIHWCQNIPSKGYFSRWHLFFITIVWTCQFVASQFESETGLCQNISSKGHFSDWNLFFVAEMRTSKFSSFQFYGKTNWCLNVFSKGILANGTFSFLQRGNIKFYFTIWQQNCISAKNLSVAF